MTGSKKESECKIPILHSASKTKYKSQGAKKQNRQKSKCILKLDITKTSKITELVKPKDLSESVSRVGTDHVTGYEGLADSSDNFGTDLSLSIT